MMVASEQSDSQVVVECPSCQRKLTYSELNPHLDHCLSGASSDALPKADTSQQHAFFAAKQSQARASSNTAAASQTSTQSRSKPVHSQDNGDDRHSSASKRQRTSPTPLFPPKPSHAAAITPPTPVQEQTKTAPPAQLSAKGRVDAAKPFAERMRPRTLSEYVGQTEIVNGPLKMLLKQGRIPSMILWGPPGTGKTTLARLLAKSTPSSAQTGPISSGHPPHHRFVEISATTAGTTDVKKIMDEAMNRLQLTGQRTLLFIDEIQRFNRAQQDVFLPSVERGHIVLVAATTENPSFRLQGALISRMRVFVLTKLSVDESCQVLRNALDRVKEEAEMYQDEKGYDTTHIDDDLVRWIANMADGDARTALGALEIALSTTDPSLSSAENIARLKTALKRTALQYDRTGDGHYDTISALHKSIRGSDPDAALYWLARMVCSGDDPLFIARRLIVAASEDINTLEALQMATATYHACQVVGLPECGENLAQCVVFLAESPKSTRSYRAWKKARAMVEGAYNHPVPLHIRNAPTRLMKDIGYGKEYRYEPSFAHPVHQEFFPPELRGTRFLSPPPLSVEEGPSTGAERFESGSTDSTGRVNVEGLGQAGEDEDEHKHHQDQHHDVDGVQSTMSRRAGIGPGSCQRLFKLGARAVDLDLLDEWERERNEGREWSGRKRLVAMLDKFGKAQEEGSSKDVAQH